MFDRIKEQIEKTTGGRLHRSHFIAIGIAIVIALWFATGIFSRSENTESELTAAEQDAANTEVTRVRVAESTATARRGSIIIRGRTEAKRAVEVRAETQGTVARLPVEKGERVSEGDVLCELAPNARGAQLAEAQALVKQRQLEYDASRQLAKKGYRAPTVAAGSKAAFDAARARLKQMQVEMEQTKIKAPFDGVFDSRPVEVGDYMRVGDTCGLVVELNPLLIVGQVSEDRVASLQIGEGGKARLVTGETAEGTIRFVAKTADPATRTFRVELEVPNEDLSMRSGVTAEIIVPGEEIMAHRIPSGVITLDDNGVIGIRAVNEQQQVEFKRVILVDDTPDGLWVTGLPEKVMLITVGQDYVKEGQKVEAVTGNQVGASL
ncbi:efflux RND transporter periplasmic adaptor subunit [Parvibaculum sp.]|jgi:membrane fusion protein, multidrug efflux system|uniref:efflux RND transporter periplasmic adaptor subunit n=1 Tax=Parvibaculum sp. TaxID=2024848 RepID=UPI000C3DA141|nr:efflux RND transporter periplasmic adaptor subunit [Parvibaculum sp.]MAM95190.1 efflux transporter periplasmic adaptor subunit [Parvibaculum sp.]HCX67733.1 efflux RND transporter periplasmic adaptor subunit [Rhodobiaceae bacterium]|tara:strand:+ start:24457 stop:25593 length:1137 start_codon:yes stop_codon:yes gene_type:complete